MSGAADQVSDLIEVVLVKWSAVNGLVFFFFLIKLGRMGGGVRGILYFWENGFNKHMVIYTCLVKITCRTESLRRGMALSMESLA